MGTRPTSRPRGMRNEEEDGHREAEAGIHGQDEGDSWLTYFARTFVICRSTASSCAGRKKCSLTRDNIQVRRSGQGCLKADPEFVC